MIVQEAIRRFISGQSLPVIKVDDLREFPVICSYPLESELTSINLHERQVTAYVEIKEIRKQMMDLQNDPWFS